MKTPIKSARSQGLMACHYCHLVVKPVDTSCPNYCPRCHSELHSRNQGSLLRTWILVVCAWLVMVPANIYPVMTVVSLGDSLPDTLLSGVMRLANSGLIFIAVIVFVASILVPIFKLVSIMMLLFVVQFRLRLNPRQCMWLYRVVEAIGVWSMLDLFVISILVTVVDMGEVADVIAGPAASAFATVVVLTLFAAMTFDSRLLWDLQDTHNE